MSVGLRKHATGRGTSAKRSRAAEVHNLSERVSAYDNFHFQLEIVIFCFELVI